MPAISLPFWIFAVAVGLPSASLCWLVLSLIFKRRKRLRHLAYQARLSSLIRPVGGRFQQDLIALQIDAVFNGLVALVETERLKLKRLMLNNAAEQVLESSGRDARPEAENDQWDTPAADHANPLERQVARCAAEGNTPDGIANQLGLSQAEVELAIKMQRSCTAQAERKLEAVA
jgi:DNA-binding NarL/FixJ family response regulator